MMIWAAEGQWMGLQTAGPYVGDGHGHGRGHGHGHRKQYRCKETGTLCYEEALHLEFWERIWVGLGSTAHDVCIISL
jgi:hypothetical protein